MVNNNSCHIPACLGRAGFKGRETSAPQVAVSLSFSGMNWETASITENWSTYASTAISAGVSAGVSSGFTGYLGTDKNTADTFASLTGGLSSNAFEMAVDGKTTFNVLNLSTFTKGQVYGGLVEMNIGGDDGFSMNWGTEGTDISAGRLSRAFGVGRLIEENRKISSANGFTRDNRIAMRALYSEGKTQDAVNALYGRLLADGDTVKFDGEFGQRGITENGLITVRDAAGNEVQSQMELALTLAHEAYRNGIYDGETEQIMETASAVLGHAKMASDIEAAGYMLSSDSLLDAEIQAYRSGDMSWLVLDSVLNYDSDSDYWRIMDDGSIKWDGQLNLYMDGETDIAQMDSEQGKVLDYRELEEVIETAVEAGKDTIMLGGKEVSVARLMQISETDRMIIASGKNPDGSYTSKAAEALFEDGYMSYEEARISQQEVMNRYNSYDGNLVVDLIKNLTNPDQLADILEEISPNMIEHYSTRFVLNENDKFRLQFSDSDILAEWADPEMKSDLARTVINKKVYEDSGSSLLAELFSDDKSVYHLSDEDIAVYKYSLPDKREFVLGVDADGLSYFQENDRYIGTYNFGEGVKHLPLDMYPYWKWGNTPDDSSPKSWRFHPVYNSFLNKINFRQ